MSDKFDVFIDSQRVTNQLTSKAIDKLTDVVNDLEKQAVETISFTRNTTWILRSLLLALILSASSLVWQVIKKDQSITKSDIMMIVEAVKASGIKTPAR